MAKIFLRVQEASPGGSRYLYPTHVRGHDQLAKYKLNDIVTAEVRRPRNERHHRLFWALISTVWESTAIQDRYASPHALAKAIELALGYFDTIKLPDGKIGYSIHSLRFESMDQAKFEEFYSRAVDVIVTQLVPHLNREDLIREVEEMVKEHRP